MGQEKAGTLAISADANLGTAPGSATAGQLNLNGGTLQTTAGFTLNSNRGIALGTGGGTINTDSGTTLAYGGIIAGSNALTKLGSGTLTLSGSNTYTGLTTISAGALRASNDTALGTTAGGVTVANGAALELSGGITIGAEALTLNGSGISSGGALRNISGNNTYQGAITQASDSRINSDSGTLTLDVASGNAIAGTFNLTLGGAGNITVSDPIATSTGTLTKDGNGTLTLSGANT
ncbi:MAG: filamentous hemagglutinin, partial [Actinobacteria bacterium]|nr:filamentous hemagglutinin [Actinomycetota bacterium]